MWRKLVSCHGRIKMRQSLDFVERLWSRRMTEIKQHTFRLFALEDDFWTSRFWTHNFLVYKSLDTDSDFPSSVSALCRNPKGTNLSAALQRSHDIISAYRTFAFEAACKVCAIAPVVYRVWILSAKARLCPYCDPAETLQRATTVWSVLSCQLLSHETKHTWWNSWSLRNILCYFYLNFIYFALDAFTALSLVM